MTEATIEEICDIKPHPNADKLELAQILGYWCVIPIGSHTIDQKVIYIRPDSVLPPNEEWAQPFLKYASKRVKAMKLRGEWSEGIIAPIEILRTTEFNETRLDDFDTGFDVTNILKIEHYNPPIKPGSQEGMIMANLPYSIPKTDEDRWENKRTGKIPFGEKVDVTLKIDGQSWSAFYNLETDEFGILGRRSKFDPDIINSYTAQVERYNIKDSLIKYCRDQAVSLCIRGESYGGGIQNMSHNPHCKMKPALALFSVYLINEHRYAHKGDRYYFKNVALDLGIPHIDIIEEDVELTSELIQKYSKELNKLNGNNFEGVVIKGEKFSFKVINKHYDSKK